MTSKTHWQDSTEEKRKEIQESAEDDNRITRMLFMKGRKQEQLPLFSKENNG